MSINPKEEFSIIIFYVCLSIGIGAFTLAAWAIVEVMKEAL